MPVVGVCVGIAVPYAKQMLNSKFTGDKYVTKSTSMINYKQKYGGKEYLIHFKYSEMLNITFVTMMYGLGIPLMFPIAALGLFMTHICEKIFLAYIAIQPPAMDDALTVNCLGMVKYAPLFLLANGWWMVGNR